jgi:hypothetical protein
MSLSRIEIRLERESCLQKNQSSVFQEGWEEEEDVFITPWMSAA